MKKRDFLKTLPLWVTPVVTSVTLPAHAQTSPGMPQPGKPTPEDPTPEDPTPEDPPSDDVVCDPQTWDGSRLYFDKNTTTRENPVLCNDGNDSTCDHEYQIWAAKPTLPLRYTEQIGAGVVKLKAGECYEFGSLLPECVDFGTFHGCMIYEYYIRVLQHPAKPNNDAALYSSNTNQGGGGR